MGHAPGRVSRPMPERHRRSALLSRASYLRPRPRWMYPIVSSPNHRERQSDHLSYDYLVNALCGFSPHIPRLLSNRREALCIAEARVPVARLVIWSSCSQREHQVFPEVINTSRIQAQSDAQKRD